MTGFSIVICGCRWRPPRWAERRWVRRRSFVPRSRLCSSSRCIDQHSVDRSTRTRLVPTVCAERSRSRLSPVAGCGRSGCRSTSLASGGTAAATASGAHSASPRLAARCAASTLPLPHVVASCCTAGSCTSLTLPCVRRAAVQTREADHRHHRGRHRGGGRLLGALRLDHGRVCAALAPLAAATGAAGRCEAVWSCMAAAQAYVAARCGGSYHQAARARRPHVSSDFSVTVPLVLATHAWLVRCEKSAVASVHFSRSGALCSCARVQICIVRGAPYPTV